MSADLRMLLHALVNPSSNEGYVRDQQTLSELFKQPEFFVALQALAADKSLSQQERLMASVITARELKTKWRSKALVPENRKPEIRERLFSFLEEGDMAIARPQLGLLVAIARIEYPKTWQNLPQLLLEPLMMCLAHLDNPSSSSSSTSTILLNTLWTINALAKEWRTVKVSHGALVMQKFEDVFTDPVGRVLAIWAEHERNGQEDVTLAEAGRYSFKILARLCQWQWSRAKGLQTQEAHQRINNLVHHSVHHAPIIQAHRIRLVTQPGSEKLTKSLTKHLRAIGKWWRVMLGLDPKGFCKIPGVTSGVGWWWGEVGGVVAGSDGAVANDVFTPHFILSAFHLLVDKLLPLTSTDLEALEDEPEEWLVGESFDEEAWSFEFRPCAERVLIALNNACRNIPKEHKVIEPEMIKLLATTEAAPAHDLPSILRREAVYCALGRLSRSIASYGGVDFNALLTGIAGWIGSGQPLHRIAKRRVAWLIGEWVSADEETAKLPIVWQMLLHLLSERSESTDKAVQLSACIAIRECVDLWELPIDYFIPYLQQTVEELTKLLGEAATLDGKRYVNDAIGVVIERVGDQILPFLPRLAQSVPVLWHSAGGLEGEWLFKASLVVLTTKLVSAARATSGDLMELVIPLIEESLQPPAKDFFEDDGLILWQTALWNAASPYQPTKETGLIRLLPGLLTMLGENMDLLSKLLPLLDSYLLLDATGITQAYGEAITSTFAKALATSKPNAEAVSRILSTISLLVRTAPLAQLAPLLLHSGIFQHITTALEDDKASGLILAAYLEILSRIAMLDPRIFLQLVAESARMQNRDGVKLLDEVLDALWRNFDYVGETRMRKAVAMGAGALLTTGDHHVLDRFDGEFMNIFLDVLGEVQVAQDDPNGIETGLRPWQDEHSTQWSEIQYTPEGKRRVHLEDSDPAYAVSLKRYIVQVLHQAHTVGLGPFWEKADEGTKRSLEKFLS
uniref:Importin N-terminal domain-containing protein n=1 Tax=Kwoniella bestiolae CBS 10118 TaxID=1296100 RepID=A0A1B9GDA8_9TREE|nr:hypothetical protein I302_00497 [Kwoniella bestiolae CBS 10118]OCF29006.1 hypothetical protein I302_00497 [Kwoniella bestiolae CBS 10118]